MYFLFLKVKTLFFYMIKQINLNDWNNSETQNLISNIYYVVRYVTRYIPNIRGQVMHIYSITLLCVNDFKSLTYY